MSENIIYLLKGESLIFLKANSAVSNSSFKYVSPLNYGDQIPIYLRIQGDFLSYIILIDKKSKNQLIKFVLPPMEKNEQIKIRIQYWVLNINKMHKNLPSKKSFSKNNFFPEETKKWLVSTESIQSNNFLVKFMSNILKGINKDILWYAKKVAFWNAYHGLITIGIKMRMVFNPFLNKYFMPDKHWWYIEDALSTLLFGGLCAGRANLIAALLRNKGIPARVVICTPTYMGKEFLLDSQHYAVEFYCPDHGWVRTQSGVMPHPSKNNIALRIITPDEENISGGPFSFYGGMHPWFWIDHEEIFLGKPPNELMEYKIPDTKQVGSTLSRGFIEKKMKIPNHVLDEIINICSDNWKFFTKNVGRCDNDNRLLFNEGLECQEKAINYFNESDFPNFFKSIKKANQEYLKIH